MFVLKTKKCLETYINSKYKNFKGRFPLKGRKKDFFPPHIIYYNFQKYKTFYKQKIDEVIRELLYTSNQAGSKINYQSHLPSIFVTDYENR